MLPVKKKQTGLAYQGVDEAGKDYSGPMIDEGLEAIAHEAMDAIKAGNAKGFAEALRAFIVSADED